MSDAGIFIVGLVTFLLFSGGITFTLTEVQRLGAQAAAKTPQLQTLDSARRKSS